MQNSSRVKRRRLYGCAGVAALVCALSIPAGRAEQPLSPEPVFHLPAVLDLQTAINIALKNQPQQKIIGATVTEALGVRQQAGSQYFPTIVPTYSFQNTRTDYTGQGNQSFFTSTGAGGQSQVVNGSGNEVNTISGGGLSIALNQKIFDTGQRELTNAEARRQLDAANFTVADTDQSIILAVTQDYYNLLLEQDLVKVDQAQIARYQQTVDLTQAEITAGTSPAADIYQSRADLANAQVTLLQNQNTAATTAASLKNELGVVTDDPVNLQPISAANALPDAPNPGPTVPLSTFYTEADNGRPDIRAQQATVEADRASLKAAAINAGFSVSGNYLLTYQPTNDVGSRGTDSQLVLSGTYPLFDAGNARGAVRVAQGTLQAAQATLDQVRQNDRTAIEQAYSTRNESFQSVGLSKSAVDAAQVNYNSAVASREAGVGTILDITTAQATLTQAQDTYVTAVYDFYIADANLRRAAGLL